MRTVRRVVPLGLSLAFVLGGGLANVQSPDPSLGATASVPASPTPSATPFPWPTVPSPG